MFNFHKKVQPKTILLTSHTVLTGDELVVEATWQERHATSNLAHIVGQAINLTDDPLDKALTHYMNVRALSLAAHQPIHDFSFSQESGISGTVAHHGEAYQIAVKGLPERVLEYCDMSDNERELVAMQVQAMSSQGLYIVAIASGNTLRPIKHLNDLKKDEKLAFTGLVGLKLGVASTARQLITAATSQSISLYLCTGLHPTAAYYLASQVGLVVQPSDVYDARHLDVIRPEEIITLVAGTNVFARATSKEKLRIKAAIQAIDDTTAVVNTIEDFKKLLAK